MSIKNNSYKRQLDDDDDHYNGKDDREDNDDEKNNDDGDSDGYDNEIILSKSTSAMVFEHVCELTRLGVICSVDRRGYCKLDRFKLQMMRWSLYYIEGRLTFIRDCDLYDKYNLIPYTGDTIHISTLSTYAKIKIKSNECFSFALKNV